MQTIDVRKPIDIEALLAGTYRRQRADAVIGRGMGLFDQEAALDPGVGEPSHRDNHRWRVHHAAHRPAGHAGGRRRHLGLAPGL